MILKNKVTLLLTISLIMPITNWGSDNSIYIEQAGDNATIDMTQDGSGNVIRGIQGVGTDNTTRAKLYGDNNLVTVIQIGSANTLNLGIVTATSGATPTVNFSITGSNSVATINSNNSGAGSSVSNTISILQTGSGQTTVVATGGVTINSTPGLKLRTQWSSATLIKRATDTWVLVGDLSA